MNHLERAFNRPNQWWKYLLMFIITFLGANFIGGIPLLIVMALQASKLDGFVRPLNPMDLEAYGINPILGLALVIIPFVVGLILFIVLVKPFHKQKSVQIITGTNKIRWNHFLFAYLIWFLLMAISSIIDYFYNPNNYEIRFNLSSLIPLAITSFLLIPLQSTYEEVMFRGYLAQGVGVLTKSRWMAVLMPAMLFAFMHAFNPEVEKHGFWLMMGQYFSFGLLFGLVSWFDDGIELAMGAHAANNVFLSIFVTADESALQTPALLKALEINPVKDFVILIVAAILFFALLKVRYGWSISTLFTDNKLVAPLED